jgi:nucleotide-binding universal stress UspA family protein
MSIFLTRDNGYRDNVLFKKILIPYDGSEPSKSALEIGIDITRITKSSQLFLLHVVPEVPIPSIYDRPIHSKTGELKTTAEYFQELYQELRTNAKKKLQHIEEKCEANGVNTEIHISSGNPSKKIVEFAKEKDIDLIIMSSRNTVARADDENNISGSRGRKTRRRIMRRILPRSLGSVSRAVAERAPCPILLLRP